MTTLKASTQKTSTPKGTQQFRLLWQLMEGHRLLYLAAVGALLLSVIFSYIVPLVGRTIIDLVLSDKTEGSEALTGYLLQLMGGSAYLKENLWIGAIAITLFAACGGIFSYFKGKWSAMASDDIAFQLKNRLYDHLQHVPTKYHDKADTGDLVQRCTSDVETIRMSLSSHIVSISNAFILMFLAIPLMYSLDPRMTAVSFSLLLPIILFGFFYFQWVKRVFREADEAEGKLTAVIQENLTGIRVVRAFARQNFEIERFSGPNARYRDLNLKLIRLMASYWTISDLIAIAQNGLVLMAGVHWVSIGSLSVGTLFAFLALLNLILWPIRQMGRTLTDLGKTVVSLGRVSEVLSVDIEKDSDSPERPETNVRGAITIDNLTFSHQDSSERENKPLPHTLNGISLSLDAGETLAILGPSGSGKSTLIHLFLRLYDYQTGSIKLDGYDLRDLERKWSRSQFGVVMQEPFLFSKTLKENISLGHAAANRRDIEEAAKVADIHTSILSFMGGYETEIGERGITLSGGQRQRVAIARAILKNPPILILDDALSAVDTETEVAVIDALRERRGKRTTIIIAHRLSTLLHADRIIVLDKGQIIQEGTHRNLLEEDGLYRRLWNIQSRWTVGTSSQSTETKDRSN
jgi:ATP-binding cassette subfamily B protein